MTKLKEIWKDVVGYEGKYQVSNIGNVKSLNFNHTGKPKNMKPMVDKDGYRRIILSSSGKYKNYKIARLFAIAFIPNPQSKPCVNHINSKRHHDNVNNLEWVTISENTIHGILYGNIVSNFTGKAQKGEKSNHAKKVRQFSLDGKALKVWKCIKVAENKLGISKGKISAVCKNKRNQTGGFKWAYVN